MKFYGIYKITNLVNGKMYVGQHVTSDLDDGYMGSGLIIKRAVEKYGTENFRKEWLMFCEDKEELDYMERAFVDQTWVDRADTYNLRVGGDGGWDYINKNRLSVPGANKGMKWTNEQKRRLSRAMKGKNSGKAPWNKGKTGVYTDEQLAKMAESSKGKKHSV